MENLILLHGAIGSSSQLEPLRLLLSDTFQVHLFDFPGHGGKAFEPEFSIAQFAASLNHFMEEKGIDKCFVFGYSMGGYVALYQALHLPGKIKGIFTLATKFHWDPETALRESKMLNPEKIEEKVPAFAKTLGQRHAPADWKLVLKKTADMMLEMGNKNPLQADDLKQLNIPVRISVGDRDQMVTLEETIHVYRHLNQGSLLVLPETQHPIEKVDSKRLKNEIVSFFTMPND